MDDDKTLMSPEAFQDLTRQIIGANGDQGAITALLTQAQDGFSGLFATHAKIDEEVKTLREENEKLKQYNLELFMQRGQNVIEQQQKDQLPKEGKSRAETITVQDLFRKEE